MSDAASTEAPRGKNPFARMVRVLVSPSETMRDIVDRPDFLIPLALILVLGVAMAVITAPHLDMRASLQPMLQQQGMKPAMQERAIEMAEKIKQFAAPLGAVTHLMNLLIIAGVFFGAFKAFGAGGSFRQFFSVAVYSWMPQIVQGVVTTALVVRKGSITTEELMIMVKSNLAFTTSQVSSPPLFALLNCLDLFNIWTVVLLTLGFSFASRFSRGKSAALVAGLWILSVLIRVALASFQGGPH